MEALVGVGVASSLMVLLVCNFVLYYCYVKPNRSYKKLRNLGFTGPKPSFPFGNLEEMRKKETQDGGNAGAVVKEEEEMRGKPDLKSTGLMRINHDIHYTALPYFARWKTSYGKVFVYWMGTEPFLYIADPQLVKQISSAVLAKNWGKPSVFQRDRVGMFGKFGLNVIEGQLWARHRHMITPAFSAASLKVMTDAMVDCTMAMINRWNRQLIGAPNIMIEVDNEISTLAGGIVAKTNYGVKGKAQDELIHKLKSVQITLFNHTRYVGVPFGHIMSLKQTMEATRLGKEINILLMRVINDRNKVIGIEPQRDLLGLLLEGAGSSSTTTTKGNNAQLNVKELVDECKTFFFGGYETVSVLITWTLMLLATEPEKWQKELREEIHQVIGCEGMEQMIDFNKLNGLKKMRWVMNEVLRLYPSSPNVQREVKTDILVDQHNISTSTYVHVIPKGTNIWIDVVGMHHDHDLWGDDVNEFKPERFQDDGLYGGCRHKMGYLPFGFGGRSCIGKNYAIMEYKIVLSLLLSNFKFELSPSYLHSPTYFFSLRPGYGVPLNVFPLCM